MGGALRRHATTILVAMVTAAVTAGGPALAHGVEHALFAHRADTVDGKHAVAARTSIADRVGKLVATNSGGQLPNNIIRKAPDADRLDGRNSSAFLSGYEHVFAQSAFDGEQSKTVVITCPAGKKVVGGGFHMSFGVGSVRWDNANVWNNHPVTETDWIVSAYTVQDGTWQLNGYAICVRTG